MTDDTYVQQAGGDWSIVLATDQQWRSLAWLIAKAIPNAIVSHLGRGFGARFYGAIGAQSYSCAFAALDATGRPVGVIVGSLDQSRAYAESKASQRLGLLLAANVRLFSPAVIGWVLRGLRAGKPDEEGVDPFESPTAELIAIAVAPSVRGRGVAQALVEAMEASFRRQGYDGAYRILTESANGRANRFYEKIDSRLAQQRVHHGREINEWHKQLVIPGDAP